MSQCRISSSSDFRNVGKFGISHTYKSWDGTNISYIIRGNASAKQTIILSNGLCCTDAFWSFFIKEFSDNFRIITIDLRGHRTSETSDNIKNLSIESHAKDIETLLDILKIEKVILCGFSIGVQINFQVYQFNPDRVQAIVAIGGVFENPLTTFFKLPVSDKVWKNILTIFIKGMPKVSNKIWHKLFELPIVHTISTTVGATNAPKERMEEFYKHQTIIDTRAVFGIALSAIENSARHCFSKINIPTLIIGGGKDIIAPTRLSLIMRNEIPGAEFLLLKKATHSLLVEHPEEINNKIGEFFNKIPSIRLLH